jgi:hypothetical protein
MPRSFPGYLGRRRPLDALPETPEPPPLAPPLAGNPSATAFEFLAVVAASPSRSTPGDAQGGEEFYHAACGRPCALLRPQLLAGAPLLPEPRHRIVCRLRRIPAASATLDRFDVPCAASRCFPRTESSPGTLVRVSPVSPPPFTACRRRRPTHPAAPPLARIPHSWIQIRVSDRISPSLKPASHHSHQI